MFDSKQQIALEALNRINKPCSLADIIKESSGAFDSKAQLVGVLKQLSALRRVKYQADGLYKLIEATRHDTISTKFTPVRASAIVEPDSVFNSIDELENKLTESPFYIQDIQLKTQVLQRLALVLSADIAAVLVDINNDLTRSVNR